MTMSDTKTNIEFSSKVFPTSGDLARWTALSPTEQREFLERSEQAGFDSGASPDEAIADRLARVRSSAS